MDKVIWNDDMTMNFLASKYRAGYIYTPANDNDRKYRVRVQIEGAIPGSGGRSGLYYDVCESLEEAKECLARLTKKLALAGVIEEPGPDSGNRFDHVELQEENDEDD